MSFVSVCLLIWKPVASWLKLAFHECYSFQFPWCAVAHIEAQYKVKTTFSHQFLGGNYARQDHFYLFLGW
jgi:hypothetical protein